MDVDQIFTQLDKSGDGTIDSSEIATLLEMIQLKPSEKFVERVKNKCDANSDGKVTKDEAADIAAVFQEMSDLTMLFVEFDEDFSQKMSFEEMRKRASTFYTDNADKYGGGKAMEIMNHWAGDKDKEMTLEEFLEIMFEDRL
ncbi:PREDICTED: polcalcin Jun o 2-like [Branchiostoma belcheri]|uniref:Polcalcin Jun o 2-like n=1 Tax=Branchiostoma belcheri TaxID=7741 RepID=A0A6P4YFV8_BRABE|nr:PREDICTED: polcalcin Jun o 2-like [Branchiostoma belcheri]